jgi:hypothetical protein
VTYEFSSVDTQRFEIETISMANILLENSVELLDKFLMPGVRE